MSGAEAGYPVLLRPVHREHRHTTDDVGGGLRGLPSVEDGRDHVGCEISEVEGPTAIAALKSLTSRQSSAAVGAIAV